MRKKVVSAILCASMVAGMVVIPGVAVKADDKKLIGVTTVSYTHLRAHET